MDNKTQHKSKPEKMCCLLCRIICSTNLCQSVYRIKISKSKYRSTITDVHVEACLSPSPSSSCPDDATLADSVQCRSPEYTSVYINKYMFSFF
ncbi:unnamed protein product [Arctogadus glacialis]